MDYKEETINTYEFYTDLFNKKFEAHFLKYTKHLDADAFIKALSGDKVLDIGCGPGIASKYFEDKRLDVVCVDLSKEMIDICLAKGLNARVMDIEELDFPDNIFNGIWSYNSLLHFPKNKIPNIILKLNNLLKQDGILGLALKEGVGEGLESDEKYPNSKRWFSYFSDPEIRGLFEPNFSIISFRREIYDSGKSILKYILKK